MSVRPLALGVVASLADEAARMADIPTPLLLAVARHESGGFYPNAYRAEPHLNDGSHGLMQMLLSTARSIGYGSTDPGAWNPLTGRGTGLYDPATNLRLGARHLRSLLSVKAGDIPAAISAYNAGSGNAKRATTTYRFCERWKPSAPTTGRSIDRDCEKVRVVRPGEFPNQPYVDAVMKHLVAYGGHPEMPARYVSDGSGGGVGPTGGTSSGPPSTSSGTTFVVRPAAAITAAVVAAILYLIKRFGG